MTRLYSVDFRTLPSQLTLSPGAKTIDGKTWWLKGSLTPGGGRTFSAALVNGSGLRLAHVAGTPSGIGSSGDLDEPHWFLPLSGLTGYIATQALLIRGRAVRNAGNPTITPLIGIADTTSDAVGLRAAQRAKDHFCGPAFTSGVTQSLSVKFGASNLTTGIGRTSSIANNECVPGVLDNHLSGWGIHGSEHQPSAIPSSIASFLPASGSTSSTTGDPHFQFTSRSNPGVLFGFTGSTGWTIDLQWLTIDVIGEIADTSSPTVELLSPPTTQQIGRKTPVVVRVTDESSLRRVYVWAEYDYGSEVIYAGDRFLPAFATESQVSGTNPRTFTLVRTGGWLAKPTIHVEPIDLGGNTSS